MKMKKGNVNNKPKNRKELRKIKRKEKKAKKNEYYVNRNKNPNASPPKLEKQNSAKKQEQIIPKQKFQKGKKTLSKEDEQRRNQQKEKAAHDKLQREMQDNRKKQLKEANLDEDKNIKFLEKQLNLNKRKTKKIPKSFADDGLDYLLEVCDSDNIKNVVSAEQNLTEINDDFEEDFSLMTGKIGISEKSKELKKKNNHTDSDSDNFTEDMETDIEEEDDEIFDEGKFEEKQSIDNEDTSNSETENSIEDEDSDFKKASSDTDINNTKKRKLIANKTGKMSKKVKRDSEEESEFSGGNEESESELDNETKGEWEDIYGRIRSADGSIKTENKGKYIPPAIRARMEAKQSGDKTISRLKKVLTGHLNRLAESNMHGISTQIEDLYMSNSRNDMNDTLTQIIMDSIISNVLCSERMVLEHVLLITILHANVGTEVGAHFLQTAVTKFDELFKTNTVVEQKLLDNIVLILAQMYNFRIFHSQLMFQILRELSTRFTEKDVECILLVFKNVGFSLRKDDPATLKDLVLDLQKDATNSTLGKEDPRVKFMLDILLAIKNNNMTKIPNYDPTYAERLKKLQKTIVRKGSYVTQLNISLEDLRKAEVTGKWWVVGSAWTGNISSASVSEKDSKHGTKKSEYSQKLLDLAKKQRMNTDVRRNIFCILMSAEDYVDAFEKLMHLGLKNQQEREIVNVILHCCLQEKTFNPYYAALAQRFCDYDRRFQVTIKYSTWDKLKALTNCSAAQISNLAKLLTHLFLHKGLPISTLKIVEFGQLDKITLRFMRQVLLGVLLCKDEAQCLSVFEKVSLSEKLKMFKQSLRLFMHHFLLKNLESNAIPEEKKVLLEQRVKLIEKLLAVNERKSYNLF